MKRLIFIFVESIICSLLMAQSVSKELATKVALQYMEHDHSKAAPIYYAFLTKNENMDTTYTHTFSVTGEAPLYLVQLPNGWVLVASEYVTTPVLASAPTGQFPDMTNIPEGLHWLLSYYEDGVRYTRDSISEISDDVRQVWENPYASTYINERATGALPSSYEISGIRPYLWNQNDNNNSNNIDCNKVYNKYCPTWYTPSCGHTYVGCTAVAMGLVMRYFQWPYSALIPNTIDSLGNTSQEKHCVVYNWDKMPNAIYNSTDNTIVNEIAGFLRDCGYTSHMEYGLDGSGAGFSDAKAALEDNFHYKNIDYVHRILYSGNWVSKLKTEIAAGRPVIYAGYQNNGKGHAFVLCGYTTDDKFLINWGWGDTLANNGSYTLNSLIPDGHISNYYKNQEAIWGITRNVPNCSAYSVLQSDITNNFEIYRGGAITAQSTTIGSSQSGVILSGEKVSLLSGFKIHAGATVYIAVKDMHCDDDRSTQTTDEINEESQRIPPKQTNITDAPPACKIFRNGQILIERNGKTYTLTGQQIE